MNRCSRPSWSACQRSSPGPPAGVSAPQVARSHTFQCIVVRRRTRGTGPARSYSSNRLPTVPVFGSIARKSSGQVNRPGTGSVREENGSSPSCAAVSIVACSAGHSDFRVGTPSSAASVCMNGHVCADSDSHCTLVCFLLYFSARTVVLQRLQVIRCTAALSSRRPSRVRYSGRPLRPSTHSLC